MSKKYHAGKKHLVRIVQHMGRIQGYVRETNESEYQAKGMQFDAINKQIDLLGEQVSKLFDSTDNVVHHYTDVPWAELRALRNRIAHDYFAVDPTMVWNFITNDIVEVEEQVRDILRKRYGVVDVPGYLE